MALAIDIPNTHLIRDPTFAEAEAAKHFSEWLDVGDAMLVYGSDLLLRCARTQLDSVEDLVVIGTVFRQALLAADGCLLCLKSAAVQAAMLHSRAEFEASLALQWILSKGKARWARQYYVSSLRQKRSWARQLIPGTDEHASATSWRTASMDSPEMKKADDARADVARIDELLASPSYRAINDEFERASRTKKGKYRREPSWYSPGQDGVANIAEMARTLGRELEYRSVYRYQSYFVHGSLADNAFSVREGKVSIEPIRYLKQFALAFNGTFLDLAESFERVVTAYRQDELERLRERRLKEWHPALMKMATVTVTPNAVSY